MNFDPNKFEPSVDMKNNFNVVTGDFDIDALELKRMIVKSMDPVSGYGWDHDTAFEIAGMYRAFLYLCKHYPKEIIVPPREVDEFWHLHILDTRNYHTDCQKIFGYYLHHFPYAGLEGTDLPDGQEEKFMENTMNLIAKHFPELLENDDGLEVAQ